MKSLIFDESRTTTSRVAYKIIGIRGSEMEGWFFKLLENKSYLSALRPEIGGTILTIDLVTHIPGVGEAFDELVQAAQGAVRHAQDTVEEMKRLEELQRKDAIARYKKSQGIS